MITLNSKQTRNYKKALKEKQTPRKYMTMEKISLETIQRIPYYFCLASILGIASVCLQKV